MDIRYFAGLFDGEGSVSILACKSGKKHYPKLVLQLTMINEILIRLIHATFGGYVYTIKRQTTAHNTPYKWMAESKVAGSVLTQLLPHLILKKRQAELALEFLSTATKSRRISPEVWSRRWEIRNEIVRLNNRPSALKSKNFRRNALRPPFETGCPSEGLRVPCVDMDSNARLEVQTTR